jgi:hypothetical protein
VSTLITSNKMPRHHLVHQTKCCIITYCIKKKMRVITEYIKQSVVSSLITSTCRVITSTRVSCCRSLHQRVVSSHQTECRVVDHYINVSCHHINQSVVLSLITSTCRVITSNRVSCRRSLHQRVVSSHQS